jgi:uncharacterized protein (TIGR01319 family)
MALENLKRQVGHSVLFDVRLACSSAAGGLKMVTIGLVPEMTSRAAHFAALGAGAKVTGIFSYHITLADIATLHALSPDVILLAGGTDGGNREVIVENARQLVSANVRCPIIVAGNREARTEIEQILSNAEIEMVVTDNVMPEINRLNIEPAREAIRNVFLNHIVHAKGIDRASTFVRVVMPTPTAVLEAAKVLAEGAKGVPGIGDLVLVDVGGATTDIHSVGDGRPSRPEVIYRGLPEPYLKRTVEGDLGLRHNAESILTAVGDSELAVHSTVSSDRVKKYVREVATSAAYVPQTPEETRMDYALAKSAIEIAITRHAGRLDVVYTAVGQSVVQYGKDLSQAHALIGTGGVFAANSAEMARELLIAATKRPSDGMRLKPESPVLYVDKPYGLFVAGLLSTIDRPKAAILAKKCLRVV